MWAWQPLHFFSPILHDFWYGVISYDATMSANIGALPNTAAIRHGGARGPASYLKYVWENYILF